MINKIKVIIFSRFKKPNKESFVEERRKQCSKCLLNSKNLDKISVKMKLLKLLSDGLTFFTRAKETQDLGQCTHPTCGCIIFFKSQEEVEKCPINKWKK